MKRPAFSGAGRAGGGVLLAYGAISFLYFGLRLLLEPGNQYVGPSDDPQIFIWSFAWWPHAIASGENPFVTHAVWAPSGLDLAWATSVPGLALLFAPLTLVAGATTAYSTAAVLMPALAAWAAFLLCRRLTRALWPSFVGGYLFGFSSYMIGQQVGGHLNLTAVFLIPLMALTVLVYVDSDVGGRWLAIRLGPLFALQMLISTEVLFSIGLVLACALAIGALLVPAKRARLRSLVVPLAGATALATALDAPFLYYLLDGFQSGTFNRPEAYVADVLNFVVPTQSSLAGWHWTGWQRFRGNIAENGAFLGPPAILVVLLFVAGRWRTAGGRFLIALLALVVFCSFGQLLTIDGHGVLDLPWRYLVDLPLFDNLLTSRLTVFVSLVVAVIVALWTAPRRGLLRWALPALAILAITPNLARSDWATTYTIPAFFTDPLYRTCLDPGENVLTLPILSGSEAKLWQVRSDFRFRLSGGGISPLPPEPFMHPYRIQYIALGYPPAPDELTWLSEFIKDKDVSSVIVDLGQRAVWEPLLDRLATGQVVGGILLYHFSALAPSCFAA